MKSLLQSRTVQIAIAQAIGGILIAVFTQLDMMAGVLLVKSVVDIVVRMDTNTGIDKVI